MTEDALLAFQHECGDELTLVELDSHLRIEESLKVQDSDKPKGKMLLVLQLSIWWSITTPPGVNVGNKANSSGTKVSVDGSSNSLKGQNMFNESSHVYYVTYIFEAYFVHDDDIAWWVDSRVTVHVCKDRCWFKTHESLNDGSIIHMRNDLTTLVHGRGCVDLKFSSRKIVSLYNVLLGYVYFKRIQDMSKNELIPAFDMNTEKCERGIKCIFVGYAEHTKAFRFYVIEPNESVSINLIIESKDAIFDENRFSSVSRPSLRIPDRNEDTGDNPKTFDKAMKSQNIALWKEAINDEMDSIMGNNTWVLAGLPPGGGTGGRVGRRGGRGRRHREGNDERVDDLNGQGNDQVMSSSNHLTSDIEDAFSSKYPGFPDYFLTSLGNTFSDSSVNPSGLIPIASPTMSLFHDDPYMKVMHAYYAKESPIPTPITSSTVLSPSPVLPLPLFNPRDFFVLEELFPPNKQVCFLSSSSTNSSDLPQNQAYNLALPSFSVYTPTPP
uniref:Zinc finger, CCHC-type n=1 Tax=Tanacetum cinerariifolium TaxID=118510 RepID=A0A6L2KL28_TANCI|nr:zinc finger, CCHC-type [Tanacetum cinerariifolium]